MIYLWTNKVLVSFDLQDGKGGESPPVLRLLLVLATGRTRWELQLPQVPMGLRWGHPFFWVCRCFQPPRPRPQLLHITAGFFREFQVPAGFSYRLEAGGSCLSGCPVLPGCLGPRTMPGPSSHLCLFFSMCFPQVPPWGSVCPPQVCRSPEVIEVGVCRLFHRRHLPNVLLKPLMAISHPTPLSKYPSASEGPW